MWAIFVWWCKGGTGRQPRRDLKKGESVELEDANVSRRRVHLGRLFEKFWGDGGGWIFVGSILGSNQLGEFKANDNRKFVTTNLLVYCSLKFEILTGC